MVSFVCNHPVLSIDIPSRSVATTERLFLFGHSFQRVHDLNDVVDQRYKPCEKHRRTDYASHNALPKSLLFSSTLRFIFS